MKEDTNKKKINNLLRLEGTVAYQLAAVMCMVFNEFKQLLNSIDVNEHILLLAPLLRGYKITPLQELQVMTDHTLLLLQ